LKRVGGIPGESRIPKKYGAAYGCGAKWRATRLWAATIRNARRLQYLKIRISAIFPIKIFEKTIFLG
jgi:hypothetical protein